MQRCHLAKRLCISPPSSQRAHLRTRPHDSLRGRATSQEEPFSGDSGDTRARTAKEEPDNLKWADEGGISFGRAEKELKRRLRLVGWQQRKGNAFVDRRTVVCLAGPGGDGAVSFMRFPFAPDNTPPDGAGGGRGGNIYLRGSEQHPGLGHLPYIARAGPGSRGMGDHRVGTRGRDLILEVPAGTTVRERRLPEDWPPPDPDGDEPPLETDWAVYADWEAARRERIFTYYPGLSQHARIATPEDERFFRAEAEVLLHERLLRRQELERRPVDVDLVENTEDPLVVAVGGEGGKGNMSFVGGYCRLPKFGTRGKAGQQVVLELELKSMADVGLVGFPNCGKSSLLRSMSESKAEVASYPFTTLSPHLGTIIVYDDGSFGEGREDIIEDSPSYLDRFGPHNNAEQMKPDHLTPFAIRDRVEIFRMVVADCPGILPDASKNVGLGRDFLRHIERSPVLAYVVDMSSRDPARTLEILRNELEAYQPGLSSRAKVVVANKADALPSLAAAEAKLDALRAVLPDTPILPTSARHRHNVARLVRTLQHHVQEARRESAEQEPARKAEREAKLRLQVDSTVKRESIFRRAGGIDYIQYATPADREAAQQLYDAGLRRAKIEESRWLAEQASRRALRTQQEAESKRLAHDEILRQRQGLAMAEFEGEHDRAARQHEM